LRVYVAILYYELLLLGEIKAQFYG